MGAGTPKKPKKVKQDAMEEEKKEAGEKNEDEQAEGAKKAEEKKEKPKQKSKIYKDLEEKFLVTARPEKLTSFPKGTKTMLKTANYRLDHQGISRQNSI